VDETQIREKLKTALAAGKLPGRAPDRIWGGRGSGAQCAVCDGPVTGEDAELELEFLAPTGTGSPVQYYVHARCWQIWESELTNRVRSSWSSGAEPVKRPRSKPAVSGNGGSVLMRADPQGNIADCEPEPNHRRGPE
jgi:hypothetical protein